MVAPFSQILEPPSNPGRFTGFILLAIFFACSALQPAYAERITVDPTFYYILGNDYSSRYDNFQAPYSIYKGQLAAATDPTTGQAQWRAVGTVSSGVTMNGRPVLKVVKEVLQNGAWVPVDSPGGEVNTIPECISGYTLQLRSNSSLPNLVYDCFADTAYPEPCNTCGGVGNPILPSTRIKLQEEVDYRSASPGGLKFVRTYRSDRNGWEHNYSINGGEGSLAPQTLPPEPSEPQPEPRPASFSGCYWGMRSSTGKLHCSFPMRSGIANELMLRRGNGRLVRFGSAAGFAPPPHINDRWTPVYADGKKVANDIYNAADDSTERYGVNGLIEKITSRNGHVTQFAYERLQASETRQLPEYVLISVTDHFGRKLTFSYNEQGRMETMTTPANEIYTYRYDEESGGGTAVGNLTSVTYPDQRKRIYWYNEPENTAGVHQPFALTGITDENGVRYATFKYDQGGFAKSTEHAGEVYKYRISGSAWYQDLEYRYVVDPLGAEVESAYAMTQGGLRLARKSQPAGAGSPGAYEFRSYDANGNLDTLTNFNGAVTKFTYDLARNLETTRIEAFGKPEQRTTTTEWHATYRIPLRVAEPKRRTTYAYFPNGELKTRTVQATTDATGASGMAATLTGTARTWTYGYNTQWQLTSVTGPIAGDVTTYVYSAITGDLLTVTNAAGHMTRFEEYDGNGRARLITQPNGVKTRLRYSPRGWLETVTVSDEGVDLTTTYGYDYAGQLKTVTAPNRNVIRYTYDDAHRLTDVADSKGNKIHYVLDNMGNRINEQVSDPAGNLRRQLTRQYDVLGRLQLLTGAAQ